MVKLTFKFLLFTLLIFVLFTYFIDPIALYEQTVFYIFQGRDLDRARLLLNGQAIFYGPETTGGGYLPGPLYYILLAFALFFKNNWVSVWVFQYILAFSSVVIGAYYLSKKFSKISGLAWIVLFSTAPFTSWFISIFLNVSYLTIFVVSALIAIFQTFQADSLIQRRNAFFSACLLIGLGIQLHYSIIFLFFALIFMLIFQSRLSLPKLSAKTVIIGIGIFLLPSVPYIAWSLFGKLGISFGVPAFYTGESDPSIISLLYLIKTGLSDSLHKIINAALPRALFSIPFPLIPLIIAHFYFYIVQIKDQSSYTKSKVTKSIKPLIICTLFSFVPYLNWYISPQAIRYTMLFYTCLIFIAVFMYASILESQKKIKTFNFIACTLMVLMWGYIFYSNPNVDIDNCFIVISVIITSTLITVYLLESDKSKKTLAISISLFLVLAINYGQKYISPLTSIRSKTIEGYMPTHSDWVLIFKTIHNHTGWNYEQAKRKIYYVGHHVNQDPELFYNGSEHKLGTVFPKSISPDGFIVSNRYAEAKKGKNVLRMNPHRWLLRQNLQTDILEGITNGTIKIGNNLSTTLLILPYWVLNNSAIPKHIHNVGGGYRLSKDDLELAHVKGNEGIEKITENEILFKWNESNDNNPFSSTGAFVNFKKVNNSSYSFNVRIVGGTISQISPWISPNWTQAWIEPYLIVKCGSKSKVFNIATSIGFLREYAHRIKAPFFSGNNSMIAPFEHSFTMTCSDHINAISLGRKGSKIEMITKVEELPGKVLTFIFE